MDKIDWEVLGSVVGILGLLGKGIHWSWSRFQYYEKKINQLEDKLKECEVSGAKKDAALEFTSRYIKDKFIDGLDNFIDNETK